MMVGILIGVSSKLCISAEAEWFPTGGLVYEQDGAEAGSSNAEIHVPHSRTQCGSDRM